MASIVGGGTVDRLIQVTDLCSPTAFWTRRPTEADENAVLIESCFRTPIRIVEMNEDFIPANKSQVSGSRQRVLKTNQLTKTPSGIASNF